MKVYCWFVPNSYSSKSGAAWELRALTDKRKRGQNVMLLYPLSPPGHWTTGHQLGCGPGHHVTFIPINFMAAASSQLGRRQHRQCTALWDITQHGKGGISLLDIWYWRHILEISATHRFSIGCNISNLLDKTWSIFQLVELSGWVVFDVSTFPSVHWWTNRGSGRWGYKCLYLHCCLNQAVLFNHNMYILNNYKTLISEEVKWNH